MATTSKPSTRICIFSRKLGKRCKLFLIDLGLIGPFYVFLNIYQSCPSKGHQRRICFLFSLLCVGSFLSFTNWLDVDWGYGAVNAKSVDVYIELTSILSWREMLQNIMDISILFSQWIRYRLGLCKKTDSTIFMLVYLKGTSYISLVPDVNSTGGL